MTRAWASVIDELTISDPGTVAHVPANQIEHPLDAGMKRSVGIWKGQRVDYRWTQDDCTCLHVHDFGDHYEAHVDSVDPDCDPILHLLRDAPVPTIAGGTALGALIGGLLGRSKGSVLAGAAIGALAATILVWLSDQKKEPDRVSE